MTQDRDDERWTILKVGFSYHRRPKRVRVEKSSGPGYVSSKVVCRW